LTFQPEPGTLLPPLTAQQELVLLARTLWHEGYDDHLAGHITYKQADGTFLTNPWYLLWDEFRPEDVVRIDIDGNVLEGRWPPAPGVHLHLALHRVRDDVVVSIHNHPRWATVWADARRIPGILDQSSALGGGHVVVVDEFEGTVAAEEAARSAVMAMGDADIALLAGHGVFLLGPDLRRAHLRAVSFAERCHRAGLVEGLGGAKELRTEISDVLGAAEFDGFWEAMARREIRRDPTILEVKEH
jgi:ribulose-5-phosphate 4-epimerase/fuculose-1-phosphate aldolase